MKIAIVASSIIPGNSLGIEHFSYGLLNALGDRFPKDSFYVLIPNRTTLEWTIRLRPRPNQVFVQARISPRASFGSGSGGDTIDATIYSWLKHRKWARDVFQCARRFELKQIMRKLQPDLIYSPFQLEILLNGPWKTVITVHDLRELMPEFFDPEGAQILHWNVENANGIVVSWKHPFEQLNEMFPSTNGKSFLIPFPVPMIYDGRSSVAHLRDQQETILYASALRPQKNHVNLIRAMEIVARRREAIGKNVTLVCAGTLHEPTHGQLEVEVKKLGLERNVVFAGFISDDALKSLYWKATMIVAPTLWEAASGAVFEAFAFRKPVACSYIPPIISQIQQCGGVVSYFNPNDPSDIARAILEVLENPLPYIKGARHSAQYIKSLSWERTAEEYMQVFTKVAGNSNP